MDTSDEWISTRTGIKQRHVVGDSGEGPVDLAVKAAEKLLIKLNLSKDKIDFVVFATSTSERYIPGSGSLFQNKMGLNNVGVLDIRQGCAGFVYAISVANQFIQTETYNNILVIGAEVHSTQLNFDNDGRNVAVLFGDGATAALLTASNNDAKGILSSHLHSDGNFIDELGTRVPSSNFKGLINEKMIKERKHNIYMNGREVFKHAVRRFPEVIKEGLEHNNFSINDLSIVIPHQANYRISKAVQEKLNINDNKVFSNIHNYGNTTAASVGIALTEAIQQGKINNNDIVVLAAFGSGFYWSSVVIRW
jgi:3-oxoacyl-[acyl-carrier-protein] synthase-3